MNFENKYVKELDCHYSRIIASWLDMGQNPKKNPDLFRDWLQHLGLSEEQVSDIYELATCGKLELETKARIFIKRFMHPWNYQEEP